MQCHIRAGCGTVLGVQIGCCKRRKLVVCITGGLFLGFSNIGVGMLFCTCVAGWRHFKASHKMRQILFSLIETLGGLVGFVVPGLGDSQVLDGN